MRLFWCVLSLALSSYAVSAEDNVAHVIAIEYPPYVSQHDPSGGISAHALQLALERAGWGMRLSFFPPARAAIELAETHDWLLSFYPPHNNPDAENIAFAPAKINYSLFRLKQAGAFKWQDLSELKGHSVILNRTNKNVGDEALFHAAGMAVVQVDSIEQGFLMLTTHRADYLLTAEQTGWYYIHKMQENPDKFEFAQTNLRVYPYTIYVNPQHPKLPQLRQALRANK